MADDATPSKPKPGSLRDRIAAFEQKAPPAAAAPPPRPKPGHLAQWKPKPVEREEQPAPSGNDEKEPPQRTGMSASDAKDSISRGGGLKERMAALQGKGAFGGLGTASAPPPPVPTAPKPQIKRPSIEAVIASREPVNSPDQEEPPQLEGNVDPESTPKDDPAVADAAQPEEEDEEAKERERRAALAARMARLGGTRVGMAPVFGKPAIKPKPKSLQGPPAEALAATVTTPPSAGAIPDAISPAALGDAISPVSPVQEPEQAAPDHPSHIALPERKTSADVATPTPPSGRSPESMPMSAVPRRAAPPRKKPTPKKSEDVPIPADVAPTPPLPTAVDPVAITDEPTAAKDETSGLQSPTVDDGLTVPADGGQPLAHDHDASGPPEVVQAREPQVPVGLSPTASPTSPMPTADASAATVTQPSSEIISPPPIPVSARPVSVASPPPVPISPRPTSSGPPSRAASTDQQTEPRSPPPPVPMAPRPTARSSLGQSFDEDPTEAEVGETDMETAAKGLDDHGEYQDEGVEDAGAPDEYQEDYTAVAEAHDEDSAGHEEHVQDASEELVEDEAQADEPSAPAQDDEEAEEAARRRRVAERMAKLGGRNPFGMPAPIATAAPVIDAPAPDEEAAVEQEEEDEDARRKRIAARLAQTGARSPFALNPPQQIAPAEDCE